MRRRQLVTGILAAVWVGLAACGQAISLGDANPPSAAKKQHVMLVSDSVETTSGAPEMIEVRFQVESGFHINSHHPQDDLLIPTELTLDAAPGVRLLGIEYPPGKAFALPGATQPLDVYQNEFRVAVRVDARHAGTIKLHGALRYQACDNAACFPPRTLPVTLLLTAR